jgi:hypothetical protein
MLVGDRSGRGFDHLGWRQVLTPGDLEVAIELIHQRDAGWDVEGRDVLVRDPVQVFDEPA